jgi:predicted unusual protein kinase regulating ubiquinone biosynthesis (AarF/ABC1/UbiB family)
MMSKVPDFLPPELTRILGVLREQAHPMPLGSDVS